jgi:hypothetical protein
VALALHEYHMRSVASMAPKAVPPSPYSEMLPRGNFFFWMALVKPELKPRVAGSKSSVRKSESSKLVMP